MKLKLVGNMLIVTSDIKSEDLEKAKKIDALVNRVVDEEGNEAFIINYNNDKAQPSFAKYSCEFNQTNTDGKMEAIIPLTPSEDYNEQIVEMYGAALNKAKTFESIVKQQVKEVLDSMNGLLNSIETEGDDNDDD